jgi:putative flippase GtrA
MDLPPSGPSGLIAYAGTDEGRKRLRYAAVSAVFLPLGQVLLQVFGLLLDDYAAASLLSAAILTLPNFFANKHFVWRITSRENLHSQVLVFWAAVMLGVSLATLFTYLVQSAMADQPRLVLGAAVLLAQEFGYGLVWVGRFLLLDRWLFKIAGDAPEKAREVIGEIPT